MRIIVGNIIRIQVPIVHIVQKQYRPDVRRRCHFRIGARRRFLRNETAMET